METTEQESYIIDGSDASFTTDVVEASKTMPVIVDFWAPWCGPCNTLKPKLEALVREAGGAVKLVKINTDAQNGIAGQLNVRSIPAVFAFKDGKPVDGFVGARPDSELVQFIENQIKAFTS